MKYLTLAILSVVLTACGSGDNPEVRIVSATHAGTGCPAGTGSVILADDRKTLSVLFDEYRVEAGVGTGPTGEGPGLTTKTIACNIAVSLHIPSGYQAFLIGANFKGSVSLPEAGEAKFKRQYFFAGDGSEVITKDWKGEVFDEEIDILDDLYVDSYSYSRCGEDVILRSNSSLSVKVPDADADTALLEIGSFDYKHQENKSQFVYQFSYEKCS